MNEDVRKIQLAQLDLMKKLHKICVGEGINYIIIGGTLLGAVRHKGFIPWDDDFDIALMRKDYDKLLNIITQNPIEGCFLQTHMTDQHYVQPYAKLRIKGTKFVEKWFKDVPMDHGIFIDIFPYDRISSPSSPTAVLRKETADLFNFAIWRKEKCFIKRKGWKKIEYITSSVLSLLPKRTLVNFQNDLMERENKNWDYVAQINGVSLPRKTCIKREDFEDTILMDFEDTQFYGPRKYKEVLTNKYGDYMKLPPENQRNSGHNVVESQL